MKYEVIRRYVDDEGMHWLPDGTSLEIRIHPEKTDLKTLFTAMIQTAYQLAHRGSSMLPFTDDEAEEYFCYSRFKFRFWPPFLLPDKTSLSGINADMIREVPTRLIVRKSSAVEGTYIMDTVKFVQEIDRVERLFEQTQLNLDQLAESYS